MFSARQAIFFVLLLVGTAACEAFMSSGIIDNQLRHEFGFQPFTPKRLLLEESEPFFGAFASSADGKAVFVSRVARESDKDPQGNTMAAVTKSGFEARSMATGAMLWNSTADNFASGTRVWPPVPQPVTTDAAVVAFEQRPKGATSGFSTVFLRAKDGKQVGAGRVGEVKSAFWMSATTLLLVRDTGLGNEPVFMEQIVFAADGMSYTNVTTAQSEVSGQNTTRFQPTAATVVNGTHSVCFERVEKLRPNTDIVRSVAVSLMQWGQGGAVRVWQTDVSEQAPPVQNGRSEQQLLVSTRLGLVILLRTWSNSEWRLEAFSLQSGMLQWRLQKAMKGSSGSRMWALADDLPTPVLLLRVVSTEGTPTSVVEAIRLSDRQVVSSYSWSEATGMTQVAVFVYSATLRKVFTQGSPGLRVLRVSDAGQLSFEGEAPLNDVGVNDDVVAFNTVGDMVLMGQRDLSVQADGARQRQTTLAFFSCGEGFVEGQANCTQCVSGWYLLDDGCVECPANATLNLVLGFVVVLAAVWGSIKASGLRDESEGGEDTDEGDEGSKKDGKPGNTQRTRKVKDGPEQVGKENAEEAGKGTKEQLSDKPSTGRISVRGSSMVTPVVQLMHFVQVAALIPAVVPSYRWPTLVSGIYVNIAPVNLNVDAIGLQCEAGATSTLSGRHWLLFLAPLVVYCFLGAVLALAKGLPTATRALVLRALVQTARFLFLGMTVAAVRVFDCNTDVFGVSRMGQDASIVCYSAEWWEALVPALVGLILNTVIPVVGYVWILAKWDSGTGGDVFYEGVAFLFVELREGASMYELTVLLRKLLFTCMAFFMDALPNHVLYGMTSVFCINAVFVAVMRPYRRRRRSFLEALLLLMSAAICVAMGVAGDDLEARDGAGVVVLLSLIVSLVASVVVMVLDHRENRALEEGKASEKELEETSNLAVMPVLDEGQMENVAKTVRKGTVVAAVVAVVGLIIAWVALVLRLPSEVAAYQSGTLALHFGSYILWTAPIIAGWLCFWREQKLGIKFAPHTLALAVTYGVFLFIDGARTMYYHMSVSLQPSGPATMITLMVLSTLLVLAQAIMFGRRLKVQSSGVPKQAVAMETRVSVSEVEGKEKEEKEEEEEESEADLSDVEGEVVV